MAPKVNTSLAWKGAVGSLVIAGFSLGQSVQSQPSAAPVLAEQGSLIQGRISITETGEESSDLSDFVITFPQIEGDFPPPAEPVVMDQKNLRFVPHVLVILAGTTVVFPNSDPVLHNVFSISKPMRFNLGLYRRSTVRKVRFERPGVVELLCNVHLEMSAYIVVTKNPYYALTGPDGSFRIANVPPGRRLIRCRHERYGVRERQVNIPAEGTLEVNFVMGEQPSPRGRKGPIARDS